MNDVLSRLHRGPSTCFAVSGLSGLVQGCYAPETLWPLLDPPLRDGLRGGFLDLENGAIWPLNGLRAKKFHVFRIKGLDTDPWGGRVNARNEKPVLADGFFQVSQS